MAFKAGAIVGDAILNTAKWTSGVGIVQKTSKKLGGVLTKLAKYGFMAVAAGMTAAIFQANKYQKEFRNVSTLTEQNTKDLQDMSLSLLSLDSQLGSTTQLTRSMYDAISAGAKPGKQAFEVIESSAKFAKAAMADNAASVRLLSATVNAYGKEAKTMAGEQLDAEAAADIFFKTIKLGVVTGEQLSSSIGDSIPLFASMKIPVEQLAAGMAAMTKQGVNAAQSTTQLNAIINAFLKPSSALTEVLKEQGYESGQAFIQSEGLAGALELLKTTTESGKFEMAELTRNIRAIKGVLALSGEGAKIFNETLEEMENAGGAVNTAFAKQEKTFFTLKNEMGKTAIIAGNIGKHFVDDIAGGAQSALEALNQFIVSGRALETFANIASKVGSKRSESYL
jgi:TP901 family phage tail tape measure protein